MYLSCRFECEDTAEAHIVWIWIDPAASKKGWVTGEWVATTYHELNPAETLKRVELQNGLLKLRYCRTAVAHNRNTSRVIDGGAVYHAYMPGNEIWPFVESVEDAHSLWSD